MSGVIKAIVDDQCAKAVAKDRETRTRKTELDKKLEDLNARKAAAAAAAAAARGQVPPAVGGTPAAAVGGDMIEAYEAAKAKKTPEGDAEAQEIARRMSLTQR